MLFINKYLKYPVLPLIGVLNCPLIKCPFNLQNSIIDISEVSLCGLFVFIHSSEISIGLSTDVTQYLLDTPPTPKTMEIQPESHAQILTKTNAEPNYMHNFLIFVIGLQ